MFHLHRSSLHLQARWRLARDARYFGIWSGPSRWLFPIAIGIGGFAALLAAGLFATIQALEFLFESDGLGGMRWVVILLPAAGGLLAGALIAKWSPETAGSGIPEVLFAVTRRYSRIGFRTAIWKTLNSALTIGLGGSAGREGPIVQVGAAIGSSAASLMGEPHSTRRIFLACGTAAGISASFNAPISGMIFAIEMILRDLSARSLALVVTSSITASLVAHAVLGEESFFIVPQFGLESGWQIPLYVVLGFLAAGVARLFVVIFFRLQVAFESSFLPVWLRPAVGGLGVGLIGFYLPEVFGNGKVPIEDAVSGGMELTLLMVLLGAKVVATSLTLGSGGSGGVFAPLLFAGAMLGAAYGIAVGDLFPLVAGDAGGYALVGMSAMFAGAAFTPITSVLIIFEMTRDYDLILPLMAGTMASVMLSRRISHYSIFTIPLRRRGIDLDDPDATLAGITVGEVMAGAVEKVRGDVLCSQLGDIVRSSKHSNFPVVDADDRVIGMLSSRTVIQRIVNPDPEQQTTVSEVMMPDPPVVTRDNDLARVVDLMHRSGFDQLPVVNNTSDRQIVGIVTDRDVVDGLSTSQRQRRA